MLKTANDTSLSVTEVLLEDSIDTALSWLGTSIEDALKARRVTMDHDGSDTDTRTDIREVDPSSTKLPYPSCFLNALVAAE